MKINEYYCLESKIFQTITKWECNILIRLSICHVAVETWQENGLWHIKLWMIYFRFCLDHSHPPEPRALMSHDVLSALGWKWFKQKNYFKVCRSQAVRTFTEWTIHLKENRAIKLLNAILKDKVHNISNESKPCNAIGEQVFDWRNNVIMIQFNHIDKPWILWNYLM